MSCRRRYRKSVDWLIIVMFWCVLLHVSLCFLSFLFILFLFILLICVSVYTDFIFFLFIHFVFYTIFYFLWVVWFKTFRLMSTAQWSNYGGAQGGLAHLKDLAAPAKHLFWEGSRGPVKGPLKLQDDHPLSIDALLQFASVFCTEIAVEKHLDPRNVTFGGAVGPQKFF